MAKDHEFECHSRLASCPARVTWLGPTFYSLPMTFKEDEKMSLPPNGQHFVWRGAATLECSQPCERPRCARQAAGALEFGMHASTPTRACPIPSTSSVSLPPDRVDCRVSLGFVGSPSISQGDRPTIPAPTPCVRASKTWRTQNASCEGGLARTTNSHNRSCAFAARSPSFSCIMGRRRCLHD